MSPAMFAAASLSSLITKQPDGFKDLFCVSAPVKARCHSGRLELLCEGMRAHRGMAWRTAPFRLIVSVTPYASPASKSENAIYAKVQQSQ